MSSLEQSRRPAVHVEECMRTAIRAGRAYTFTEEQIVITAASPTLDLRFTTGDNVVIFASADYVMDQEQLQADIYENTTFSADGTLNTDYITAINRAFVRASQIQAYDGAVVDTLGTRIHHQLVTGTAGQNQSKPGSGSGSEADVLAVLAPNTEHVLRLTNASALDITINVHYKYYEAPIKWYSPLGAAI